MARLLVVDDEEKIRLIIRKYAEMDIRLQRQRMELRQFPFVH